MFVKMGPSSFSGFDITNIPGNNSSTCKYSKEFYVECGEILVFVKDINEVVPELNKVPRCDA
jgi:hypothetical protein